ncbi:MAG TPA: prepilin-type N-terminal cleavage/methylation domain-containing protein [Rhodocyclaceae bacterium]|nr:prepilin-type N-terminal cleavage/methylation domain-containing protein [Rhodocyclaceae bacterium]
MRRTMYDIGLYRSVGFTLIEMVISLTLIAIMSAMMAVFLRVPMESHFVTRQRLTLTDAAELAIRHMDQEMRTALPNSVRVLNVGAVTYVEFLAVRTYGHYRTTSGGPTSAALGSCAGGVANNLLNFVAADNCFTTLGVVPSGAQIVAGQDYVVIDNRDALPGSIHNAYTGGNANKSLVTAYAAAKAAAPTPPEDRLQVTNFLFPSTPASKRFYVVSGAVTYACSPNAANPAAGQLLRYSGYGISAAQAEPPAVAPSIIVQGVSACQIPQPVKLGGLMGDLVTVSLALASDTTGGGAREEADVLMQIPVNTWP